MAKEDISSIVRIALAGVPTVGGALAQAWSEWDNREQKRRVQFALDQILMRLQETPSIFHPESLSYEHWDLLQDSLERIARESRERKRRRFHEIVLRFWTMPGTDYNKAEEMLNAVSSLGDIHIQILCYLVKQTNYPSFNEIVSAIYTQPATDEHNDIILSALNGLASDHGFIRRNWSLGNDKDKGLILTSHNLSPEGIARKCKHMITERGKEFLCWIREGNNIV
jgi:hypothetical protein